VTSDFKSNDKEISMKRFTFVLALAVVLTMMFAATAVAEHSPSNFSQWKTSSGTNSVVPSPHAGYTATTVKCNVCHSVHRSAVMGQSIRNQVNGDWIKSSTKAPAEMLLRSSVADSCDYCHIDSAAGGVRLYNGNSLNRPSAFDGGYGHTTGNACVYCHAAHGANTFKGAAAGKVLKYTADQHTRATMFNGTDAVGGYQAWGINPAVAGNVANHTFTNPDSGQDIVVGIQDEIYTEDASGVLVDPLNKAQVIGLEELILGSGPLVNSAIGADYKDVQVGAFCTLCHQTYASDSYAVVNPDQDAGLYGGTYGAWTDVAGFAYQSGTWKGKGHPLTDATNDFAAMGSTLGTGKTVAWADADTCRKCHDAGTDDAAPGVVYSSWPHITPGYYRFMGSGESAAEYAAAGSVQADMVDDATGWLAAGEYVSPTPVSAGGTSPTVYEGYMLYPGQNYKNNDPAAQFTTQFIGRDGLCLKCHVQAAAPSLGIGRSF
jgi:hypothetical protein